MIRLISKACWNGELTGSVECHNCSIEVLYSSFSADDLGQLEGLEDRPRWAHIEQARLYCELADEMLRAIEVWLT